MLFTQAEAMAYDHAQNGVMAQSMYVMYVCTRVFLVLLGEIVKWVKRARSRESEVLFPLC